MAVFVGFVSWILRITVLGYLLRFSELEVLKISNIFLSYKWSLKYQMPSCNSTTQESAAALWLVVLNTESVAGAGWLDCRVQLILLSLIYTAMHDSIGQSCSVCTHLYVFNVKIVF